MGSPGRRVVGMQIAAVEPGGKHQSQHGQPVAQHKVQRRREHESLWREGEKFMRIGFGRLTGQSDL